MRGLRIGGARGQLVRFSFEDDAVTAFAGETVAAALLAAGVRVLGRNAVDATPRGVFCAMGSCQECLVLVDGTKVEACRARVREGMVVQRAP